MRAPVASEKNDRQSAQTERIASISNAGEWLHSSGATKRSRSLINVKLGSGSHPRICKYHGGIPSLRVNKKNIKMIFIETLSPHQSLSYSSRETHHMQMKI
jgi:hypothetical protein